MHSVPSFELHNSTLGFCYPLKKPTVYPHLLKAQSRFIAPGFNPWFKGQIFGFSLIFWLKPKIAYQLPPAKAGGN